MKIIIEVPTRELVTQIGNVVNNCLSCNLDQPCEQCENYEACECLSMIGDACDDFGIISDGVCEVAIHEE